MSEQRGRGPASAAQPSLQAAVQRWSLPEVSAPGAARVRNEHNGNTSGMDALRQALEQGEARGYQAGVARAQAQSQAAVEALLAKVAQLESIVQLLARPLQQLDAEIEKELLNIALLVGKQLARRELRVDPAQVIGIIRESLAQLPAASREVRVHLHPEDAATVRERLATPTNERAWTMVEDPTLTRGGCLVRTDTSQIDVRLESRVNAVIASALGEERAPERPSLDVEQQP